MKEESSQYHENTYKCVLEVFELHKKMHGQEFIYTLESAGDFLNKSINMTVKEIVRRHCENI